MAGQELLVLLLVVSLDLELALGAMCTTYYRYGYSTWDNTRYIYCTFGCCGAAYSEYCCSSSGGMIGGIVFGAICFISIVSVIVCCCIKHVGHRGRVIQPAPHTNHANIVVVSSGTTAPAYSSPYPLSYNSNFHTTTGYPEPTLYPPGPYQGAIVPPAYGQTGVNHPPPYGQVGGAGPPPYGQMGVAGPPPYGQGTVTQPPPYSQTGVSPFTSASMQADYPPKPPPPPPPPPRTPS